MTKHKLSIMLRLGSHWFGGNGHPDLVNKMSQVSNFKLLSIAFSYLILISYFQVLSVKKNVNMCIINCNLSYSSSIHRVFFLQSQDIQEFRANMQTTRERFLQYIAADVFFPFGVACSIMSATFACHVLEFIFRLGTWTEVVTNTWPKRKYERYVSAEKGENQCKEETLFGCGLCLSKYHSCDI